MPGTPYYPLKLTPLAVGKIWGGDKLTRLSPATGEPGERIGEVWSVWDQLTVAEGAAYGLSLAELARRDPVGILGARVSAEYGDTFPLLVKFIDARDVLSIQVHPDDRGARAFENQPFGKSEVWYVVEAEAGTRVIHGLRRTLDQATFRAALAERRLVDELQFVDVAPGDVVLNLPGTIHALGAGALIYELQQSADITYRLYDWDRLGDDEKPRALHLERGLAVSNLGPAALDKLPGVDLHDPAADRTFLCATRHYAAELYRPRRAVVLSTGGECFHILTAIRGSACVRFGPGAADETPLSAGESLVLPAALGEYSLQPRGDGCEIVKAYVPDLRAEVIEPLRNAGVSSDRILALGGGADDVELRDLLGAVGAR
jgi:mannose-6-phosphate isomerase